MTATTEGTTFHPGDIVRVRDASDYGPAKGRRARVIGPHRSYSDMINVEWLDSDDEDDRDGDGWLIDRFELVPAPEPEPFDPTGYVVVDREPKVGDRVVSRYSERGDENVTKYDGPGVVAPIPADRTPDSSWFNVELDNPTHTLDYLWLARKEFDVLEKVKPQLGDVVKHDAGTTYLPAGATGDVIHVWGDGMVHVKWHDRSKQWSDGGLWSSGLTVVKQAEAKLEPLFQVGDRVVSHGHETSPRADYCAGIGTVTGIEEALREGEDFIYTVELDKGVQAIPYESELGYLEEPAPDEEPLAAWEKELLGIALDDLAADSGIYGTVEDEAGLRALGKGAVIQSSVNRAEYVRITDNHYRTTLVDYGQNGFGYNYASIVFGAVRNGLTFLVLHPGLAV